MAIGGALGQEGAAGALRGKIMDEDFGAPLTNARITIQELNQSVNSGDGGTYVFENVPPGVYTLAVNKGGYERKFRREVVVRAGQMTEVDEGLVGEVFEMDEMVVEAEDLVGGSEVELISLRTETSAMVDAVGSDMLSKAGASDAADAVKLVVGVTVSEDKTATVRGLGDRYTVTTLNGARVPSSNPVRRAVELDQFPTSLVESVTVSKTFLPDMQGEATGGGVNIKTKAIPDGKIADFSASVGFDSQATGNDRFRTYDGAGEALGMDVDDSRGIPVGRDELAASVGDSAGNAKLTDKFDPVMGTKTKSPEPDSSYGISVGDRIPLDEEQAVGVLFNMDYGKNYDFIEEGRRIERLSPASGTHNKDLNHDYTYDEGTETVNVGSSLSVGYQFNEENTVQLTGVYSSVTEDTAVILRDTGRDDVDGADFNQLIDVDENIRHRERLLATVQLRGEHKIGALNDAEVDWLFASSFTRQYDPDTRYFRYEIYDPAVYGIDAAQVENGNGVFPERNWQTVEDEAHQGAVNFKIPFDTWNEKKGHVKFGPYGEYLQRDYDIARLQYTTQGAPGNAFFINGFPGFPAVPSGSFTEGWFDEDYNTVGLDDNGQVGWTLAPGGIGNIDYEGEQLIHAIYLMGELPVTERLIVTGGARLERTEITTEAAAQGLADTDANPATPPVPAIQTYLRPAGSTKFTEITQPVEAANTDLTEEFYHPAISISYEAVDDMYFRAAWSKTTARPTFRELVPTLSQTIDDNAAFVGNPNLRMSESYNYDFRWEWFPRMDSVLAFSGFYKYLQDPIETIAGSSSGQVLFTKENFTSGEVLGFEVEAKTGLGVLHDLIRHFNIGANFAWIESKVRMPGYYRDALEEPAANNYDPDQPLTGTPAYLVNANFGYDNPDTGTSFNIFYNWQGETLLAGQGINSVDGTAVPARYARPFDSLGVGISQKFGEHVKMSLKAKNILNNRQEVIERLPHDEDVLFKSVTRGVDLSFGLGVDW